MEGSRFRRAERWLATGGCCMLRRRRSGASRGDNVVVGAATADRGPIGPVRFWAGLRGASFDVAAHDLAGRRSLTRLAALRRVLGGKPLWLTGVGVNTPPEDPRGVSPETQARFLSQALYRADRAGVSLFAWNGLQDRASYLPGFPSIASGLFFNYENDLSRDPAKPALEAYRFPFVVHRETAWGIAPLSRRVVIQRWRGGRWRAVASVMASRSGEFSSSVHRGGLYRAVQARAVSPAWRR